MTKSFAVIPWVLAATACGDVPATGADARLVDSTPDIDADLRACDPQKPFGDLRPVAGIGTADGEINPSLSADELTVYFFSNRQNPGTADFDAYVATRPARDAAFGAPGPITAINTPDDQRGGSLSSDGRSLFYHSSITGEYNVYVATRANAAAPFGAGVSLGAGVNTANADQQPFIAADGATLYFDRTPAAGGMSSIYRASAGPTGFTGATMVSELSTPTSNSARPVVSADGLTVYFSSDRPGGAGSLDIWVATRPSLTAPFDQITNVAALNGSGFEFADWLSADDCRIYFSSQRTGGAGGADIWQATRPR